MSENDRLSADGNPKDLYPQSGPVQTFEDLRIDHTEGDKAVKLWFLLGALWFAVFTTFGLLLAIKFFFPTFLGEAQWLTFGVVRPAHVNGVLFGFVSSGLLGAMFYAVPRLCARPIFKPRLAIAIPLLWNTAVLTGIVWILMGGSQGREYAELPWVIDVAVMVTLVLMAVVILGTIAKRREKKLYVSLWYYAGTMLWFPIVYFIGNVMWNSGTGALNGINDAMFNWYYGHNVLGLWFTTLGIPAVYYAIPHILKRPLYSHLLSLISFFSIAFFYTGVGAHHLLQAPIPEWVKTIAVLMTVLMLVPVLAFATNIFLTIRGSGKKILKSPILQFLLFGLVCYIFASLQGSLQGVRLANQYLHFSQWTVGHSHLALLGGFGFIAAGLALWVVPHTKESKIYSAAMLKASFWIGSVGFLLFFLAMTIAGLIANANWWSHVNVVELLPMLRIPYIFRAVSGAMVVVAAYLVAINVVMTFKKGKDPLPAEDDDRPEGKYVRLHSAFQRKSQKGISLPVIFAGGLAGFTLMTFMVVAMPYMFTSNEPSDTPAAHVLTVEEQAGENVYKANGCFYCHNQFIRETDWAMGDNSEPGDFYYSIPNFMGTERTGPSLGAIGGKRPTQWHFYHYTDPRSVSPSSIMPPFSFLNEEDLSALMEYIQNLGGKDLEVNAYQPLIPLEYRDAKNPYLDQMAAVAAQYDPNTQTYSGTDADGTDWAALYEAGKALFTQKCLPCHNCSGNGQGSYARQTLAHPANLHERISNFPEPADAYHIWRVSEGVAGTAMPPWGWSLDEDTIEKITLYEMSFVDGSLRTISGDISDAEGDQYDDQTHITPGIAGTEADFIAGRDLFNMYCTACHGPDGKGNGPASILADGGYITPQPANFTESGSDFTKYGRYVWKVREGVETTNMPPWKMALQDTEIFDLIFYIQAFSVSDDYNTKWAPLYTDAFARTLKE